MCCERVYQLKRVHELERKKAVESTWEGYDRGCGKKNNVFILIQQIIYYTKKNGIKHQSNSKFSICMVKDFLECIPHYK